MSMKSVAVGLFALVAFVASSYGPATASARLQAEPEEEVTQPAEEPEVAEADEAEAEAEAVMSCGDCHDVAEPFKHNPHARGKLASGVVPNDVCESCHGDGTAHMEAGGDTEQIFVPRGLTGADSCLVCHAATTVHRATRTAARSNRQPAAAPLSADQAETLEANPPAPEAMAALAMANASNRGTGVHANSDQVNCLTCHSIHSAEARSPQLLVSRELEVCSTCHSTKAASFRANPFAHRVGRGGMECSSCHDPHAPRGRENFRSAAGTDLPCLNCHTEKKGPFVFPHNAGTVGDCTSCHAPHGSPNPKQLTRATVAQLCMECHSPITPDTLGSQPPSFHNLLLPRYQNCTSCHTAVHGSNRSPQLLK